VVFDEPLTLMPVAGKLDYSLDYRRPCECNSKGLIDFRTALYHSTTAQDSVKSNRKILGPIFSFGGICHEAKAARIHAH
jgi:hypothetical protein